MFRWVVTPLLILLLATMASNSVTTYGSAGSSREHVSSPSGSVSLAAAGRHSGGPGGSGQMNLDPDKAQSGIGAAAPFAGAPAPLEAQVRLNYRISEWVRVGGYIGHGLSDGSPDIAAGIVFFRSFN